MKLFLACDHRGHEIEEELVNLLKKDGYEVITSNLEHDSDDDYVDFALDVLSKMNTINDLGILICGNGIGMSIIANKVYDIRCARVLSVDDAVASRQHNGANVIALGTTNVQEMYNLIKIFITTNTPNIERHMRRLNKIINFERETK